MALFPVCASDELSDAGVADVLDGIIESGVAVVRGIGDADCTALPEEVSADDNSGDGGIKLRLKEFDIGYVYDGFCELIEVVGIVIVASVVSREYSAVVGANEREGVWE